MRAVHGRRHQDTVTPELHGQRSVRGGADACIEDHGYVDGLAQQGDVVGVPDPEATPDGRPQGHDRGAADLLQPEGQHGVVGRIRQDDEPVVHQLLGGGQSSTASGRRVRSSPITSNFTQSVAKASRASLAVSTASLAVKHPAVLGRTRTPTSVSRSNKAPLPEGSTRRTATVASAVPDSTRASRSARKARHPAGAQQETRRERLACDAQGVGRHQRRRYPCARSDRDTPGPIRHRSIRSDTARSDPTPPNRADDTRSGRDREGAGHPLAIVAWCRALPHLLQL